METKTSEFLATEKTTRERGLRVVAIGGGTGLSTLLKGLKRFVLTPAEVPPAKPDAPVIRDLCAIVTVSDDGGSSGRLRKELNMLPPGDIRNCIVALSEDEALLSKLFRHRFDKGSGLEGHSFGNLFLAALTSITSDFSEAVRLSSEILLTRGHIYPATTSNIELEARMEDGTRVRGETNITASKGRIQELFLVPPDVGPMPQTLEAIAHADVITIGPGSLFTSLIPNLLVRGIAQAIVESPATKVYICNLMTQANESLGLNRRRPHSRSECARAETNFRLRPDQPHSGFRRTQGQVRRRRRLPDRERSRRDRSPRRGARARRLSRRSRRRSPQHHPRRSRLTRACSPSPGRRSSHVGERRVASSILYWFLVIPEPIAYRSRLSLRARFLYLESAFEALPSSKSIKPCVLPCSSVAFC